MTIACLLRNTMVAACRRSGRAEPEELTRFVTGSPTIISKHFNNIA